MMKKSWHRWFASLAFLLPALTAQAQQFGPGYAPAPPSTAPAPAGSYYARVAGQLAPAASSPGLVNPYAGMQQSAQPVMPLQMSQPSAPAGPQSTYLAAATKAAAPTGLRFPAAPSAAPQMPSPPTMAGPAPRMTISPLNGLQQVAWQQPRSFTQSRAPSPTPSSSYHAALLVASNQPTLAPPQNSADAGFGAMPAYPTTPNFASAPVVTETIGTPAVDGLPPTSYSGPTAYPPLSSYPLITPPPSVPVTTAPAPANSTMWQQSTPAPSGAYPGMTSPRMPPMGPTAYPDPNVSGPGYDGMFDSGPAAASADWMQTGGPCNTCPGGNCGPWFASISGLYMTRDAPNNVGLAFLNAVPQISVLNTELAGYDWKGGFELKLGRTLGDNWALETNYWYLDPSGSTTSIRSDANDISSRLDTQNLAYQGQLMSDYYNNAHEQRVNRTNDFMNLEINLWQQALQVDPGSRWGMAFFSGVRWFRFREMVEYGTAMAGADFEDNDIATQSWYHVRLTNNLIGWQLGARSQLYLGPKLRLFAVPRAGLFANVLNMHQDFCMVINNSTEKTDIAMLGQIDLGAAYQLFNCCSMFISYRAMGIAGVANADDNIQPWLISQPDMMQVQSSGSLIMHGVNAGLQFQF